MHFLKIVSMIKITDCHGAIRKLTQLCKIRDFNVDIESDSPVSDRKNIRPKVFMNKIPAGQAMYSSINRDFSVKGNILKCIYLLICYFTGANVINRDL